MCFHGRMKMSMKKKFKLLLIVLVSATSFAEDFGQTVPGQDTDSSLTGGTTKVSPHVPGQSNGTLDDLEVDGSSAHIQRNNDSIDEVKGKGSPTQFNNTAPFTGLKSDTYLSYTNEGILNQIYNKSESTVSVKFYNNDFDYKDKNGVYNKTFDSDSGAKGASLNISRDLYLSKGVVNFAWGMGSGLGYSTGKGIFAADGSKSTMRFNLYSVPLDIRLVFEAPLSKYMKLSLAAGPSAMGLIQNRSDRDRGDRDKTKYQLGYGYFGEGKLKFNLGYIFTDTGFEYYKSYEVSFMSLDLLVRNHSYSGFADDITISGMSYGLGFTFEFL